MHNLEKEESWEHDSHAQTLKGERDDNQMLVLLL